VSDPIPDWIKRVSDAIKPLLPQNFCGKVEVNAFKGGISNVNVTQSFKEDTAK
jgi:hypothetical protein